MTTSVGERLRRREDDPLLRGRGRFIADIEMTGMLEAVFVRSQEARANILGIDTSSAEMLEDVVAVIAAQDLPEPTRTIRRQFYTLDESFIQSNFVQIVPTAEPVLASSHVSRVGEPVAMVVCSDRYTAEDARDLVFVDMEPLPAITDPMKALEPDAGLVDAAVPGNLQGKFHVSVGDPGSVMEACAIRVSDTFRIGRSVGSPIENRGVIASYDESSEVLTVWSTTQIPHVLRSYLADALERPEENIRVVTPDIGGSFGGGVYPEEILVAWTALHLGRPVRWLEDRTEDLTNSRHSRDQIIDAELGLDSDGSFRALRVRIVQDCGFVNPFGITLPHNIASHIRSQYSIDHFEAEGLCVLTNKTRNTPVRGAGRPEASFVIERLVDMAAESLGLDPAEIRRMNLIPPDQLPKNLGMMYRDGHPLVYDSGDYPDQLDVALRSAGYLEIRRRQQEARTRGRLLGVGIGAHVEGTGLGPFESAEVSIDENGIVHVRSGSQSHGQSHHTVLAQVCADVFDIGPDCVEVVSGDTKAISMGGGTFGSRSAVTAGTAVRMAAEATLSKLKELASREFEIDPADLIVRDGEVAPRGVPDRAMTLADLARRAEGDDQLKSLETFVPPSVTFGSGTQIAEVEVDPDTGMVQMLSLLLVHDCGTALNPMVVEGQQHGGVVHGLGNILLESASYSAEGQPTATNFMQYLLPTASDVPRITVIDRPHPTPLNALGVKGAGEGATASAPAAVANAIADALRPLSVRLNEMPIHPERLLDLIEQANGASNDASVPSHQQRPRRSEVRLHGSG